MPRTGRPKGANGKANGLYSTRLYSIWEGMKYRCSSSKFKRYAGRGISICQEWETFLPFYEWAISNGYNETLSIDRKDNDSDYCPENCRWSTSVEQANNRVTSRFITIGSKTQTVKQWADEYNLCDETIRQRIKAGLTEEDLIKPVKRGKR